MPSGFVNQITVLVGGCILDFFSFFTLRAYQNLRRDFTVVGKVPTGTRQYHYFFNY